MMLNESLLEEFHTKNSKELINMFKEIIEDMHTLLNKFKQARNKQLNEIERI